MGHWGTELKIMRERRDVFLAFFWERAFKVGISTCIYRDSVKASSAFGSGTHGFHHNFP